MEIKKNFNSNKIKYFLIRYFVRNNVQHSIDVKRHGVQLAKIKCNI